MASSVSTRVWSLQMPAGSLQQWTFTFTVNDAGGHQVPWPIAGFTWEYVVRASPTDTGSPLIDITTLVSAAGVIQVTATASLSQVFLQIYPAATASLEPGSYYHSLWIDPGTQTALNVFDGLLLIDGAPQP